jgi:hypothetical protein
LEVEFSFGNFLLIEVEAEEVGNEGRSDLLAHHTLQLRLPQPWVVEDLEDAMGPTHSVLPFLCKQLGNQIARFGAAYPVRELQLFGEDVLVYLVGVARVERRKTRKKLIQKCPEAVVVNLIVMAFLEEHFRSHVLR